MSISRDNYPIAAVRHFIDAELLQKNDRKDNAMCHYAFSAECVIKTMYEQFCTNRGSSLKHGAETVLADIIQFYAALRILDAKSEIILENAELPDWLFKGHPERRYEANIPYSDADLSESHAFTKKLIDELIQEVLDGKISVKGAGYDNL